MDGRPILASPEDTRTVADAGFGLTVEDARKPPAEIFREGDIIVYRESSMPRLDGLPKPKELAVECQLGENCAWTSFPLPCGIAEIPPFVKITPEAAKFIREGMRPAIEATRSRAVSLERGEVSDHDDLQVQRGA